VVKTIVHKTFNMVLFNSLCFLHCFKMPAKQI